MQLQHGALEKSFFVRQGCSPFWLASHPWLHLWFSLLYRRLLNGLAHRDCLHYISSALWADGVQGQQDLFFLAWSAAWLGRNKKWDRNRKWHGASWALALLDATQVEFAVVNIDPMPFSWMGFLPQEGGLEGKSPFPYYLTAMCLWGWEGCQLLSWQSQWSNIYLHHLSLYPGQLFLRNEGKTQEMLLTLKVFKKTRMGKRHKSQHKKLQELFYDLGKQLVAFFSSHISMFNINRERKQRREITINN